MDFVNLVRGFDSLKNKRSKHNDDLFIDRLNHRYTVVIIIIFAAVVTLSQYGGKPIKCWVPGHFTGIYGEYADNICWVSSTYNVPIHEDLPASEPDRKVKMLKYYQWTPFILLFQALLFYFPRMIWRSFNDKSGLDLQSIIDAVHKMQTDAATYSERKKFIDYLTNIFSDYVEAMPLVHKRLARTHREEVVRAEAVKAAAEAAKAAAEAAKAAGAKNPSDTIVNVLASSSGANNKDGVEEEKRPFGYESDSYDPTDLPRVSRKAKVAHLGKLCCITKGKRYGNFLLVLFLFVKILYLLNSFVQLFILNHFLGNNYLLLGADVIGKIWAGEDWAQTERFPRVTMCDFKIREVGIVHRYTVQCVLQINLFNEKIFIFIWFWLCIVTAMNIIDLLSWVYTLVVDKGQRYSYVRRRLYALKSPAQAYRMSRLENEQDFREFVNKYLREDGILALRILSRNAHDLVVSEVVSGLYEAYKLRRRAEAGSNEQQHRYQQATVSNEGPHKRSIFEQPESKA